jgi:hypothetical protein
MKTLSFLFVFASLCAAQAPIYRVSVVKSTIQAINYQHLNQPTKIDFRGTVLLPHAEGEATVTNRGQAVQVESRFKGLEPPSRFGSQFLTYVLWAITPEGRAINLGEVLSDHANKGRSSATVPLQVFGLLVTAEPYFAVAMPSNIVALENMIRPDTLGKVEPVSAKYEFLNRGEPVTLNLNAVPQQLASGEKLSMDRYNALLETYQAQNAVQMAESIGAGRYAEETLAKAQRLLRQAQDLYARKAPSKDVIVAARESAQTAEDARALT